MSQWKSEVRAIELRAVPGDADQNAFEGLACKYGVTDSYGTVFVPNCFTRGGLDNRVYSLLWMHDPTRPVGTFVAQERADGLYIVGKWDENTAGREARAAALSGSAADLSVGFTWMKDADAPEDYITVARLMEVSQVTSRFGAVPGSVLTAVRAAAMAGETGARTELSDDSREALLTAVDLLNQVLSQVEAEEDNSDDSPSMEDGARWGTEYHTNETTLQGSPEAEELEVQVDTPAEAENPSEGLTEAPEAIVEVVEELPVEEVTEEAPVETAKKKRAADIERLARYLNTI